MKVIVLNPPSKFTKNVVRDALWGCWCKGKRIARTAVPPINQVLTATFLARCGHEVTFLDALGEGKSIEEVSDIAGKFEAVVVQTSTMTFKEDSEVLGALKEKKPSLITIIYGSHPTFMPEFALKPAGVDIIIRKEHEYVLRDLLGDLACGADWKKIRGIGYKEKGSIFLNPDYPFIENLDELPFPDRTLLSRGVEYFNPIVKRVPYTTSFTSRGCPARCLFCTAPEYMGKKIRCRSAENVAEEIEYVIALGYKEVFFRDETFTFFKKRNYKICEEIIKRKLDITWICNARVGTVDKEAMEVMKASGCHMIRFGVESGVQEILDKSKKDIKIEDTKNTFRWAKEVGLETHAHMMLGMPGEIKETVAKTIDFIKNLAPTTVTFGICTPYPGTELFNIVSEKFPEIKDGTDADLRRLHTTAFYNSAFCQMDTDQLEKAVRLAYRKFYLRPSYIFQTLKRVRSFDGLRRVLIAGTSVLDFAIRGDE